MEQNELEHRLTELDHRGRSNTRRIEELERRTDDISKLATSVEVLATKQGDMNDTLKRLDGKVERIEAVPRKRWESAVACVITGVVGFIMALILHGGGLGG